MNLKHILRIASITFEENYRKKFLYILLFLSCMLILSAYLFDPFEIGKQLPVVLDVSLSGLQIFALVMTFTLFLTAIPNEIEKKTIYPLMSKPINRSDYLWGKFLGNMFMIFINLFVLSLQVIFLISRINGHFEWTVIHSVTLTFIECGIIGALITLFSPWMSYPVNLVLTFFLYISGNVSNAYLEYLLTQSTTRYSAHLALALKYFLPNFSFLHIKNSVVHSYIVDPVYIRGAFVYGVIYIFIIMLLSDILFQKKDL
jgi:ABC-type transport system involved in multi-copper enzyme maturation permease subunit